MNCPLCNETMVSIVYGFPNMHMIDLAKQDKIVLGGVPKSGDHLPTHYCHDCQEQYPPASDNYQDVLFSN